MSVINTNITSMIGQQNLNESKNALTTSMERLSSGLRINSAKDDAAGQAIANRMSSQITGLSTAQRNANDGISVAQTAEGALNQVNDNLQRVRELSVQAQNGTNSQDDLKSIQAEIEQRLTEIDRISEQTDFNGTKVLQQDGALKIQVGANDNETINIDLEKINASSLGLDGFKVSGDQKATLNDMTEEFGATGYSEYNVDVDGTPTTALRVDLDNGDVTLADGTTAVYTSATDGTVTQNLTNNSAAGDANVADDFATKFVSANQNDSLSFGGVEWTKTDTSVNADGNGTFEATIDGSTVVVSVAGANTGTGGALTVDTGALHYDDPAIYTAGTSLFTSEATNEAATAATLEVAGGSKTGSVLDIGGTAYTVDGGGVVTNTAADVMYVQNADSPSQALITEDLANQASRNPMEKLDYALSKVDTLRSDLGAIQNRFESAITNLQTNETNLTSARSRIEDADYAVEVANMTRAQILQQAGTSVLAQANQIPQSVLSLLG
ncbi:flagellin FliC [Halomonas sediminis]